MVLDSFDPRIRLIINADDFGSSHGANRAIIKAHREGILTSASLMVNGDAANNAVTLARENPTLAVGLHLTMVRGKSTLKPSEIIGVVNQRFEFDESPVRAGFRYFFNRDLDHFLKQEVDAQFREFRMAGLQLDHLNGHLHFHLHPTIFNHIKRHYRTWGISAMRLTREPLLINLRLAFGRYFYRLSHAFIFDQLSANAAPSLERRDIKHADYTFGLLQDGRLTEKYLLRLIDNLWPGTFEIFCHPDEEEHAHELAALTSPRVKELIRRRGIELIRYSDL
jgi:chitin disaccharide deacetylase